MASLLDSSSGDNDDENQDILMMLMLMQNSNGISNNINPTSNNNMGSINDPSVYGLALPHSQQQLQQTVTSQEVCSRCGVAGGCDLRLSACGCCFHARCLPLTAAMVPLRQCPSCQCMITSIRLLPMHFQEMEEAKAAAAVAAAQLSADNSAAHKRRGQKRKHATLARINPELFLTTTAVAANSNLNSNNNSGVSEGAAANEHSVATTTSAAPNAATPESSDLRTGRWTTEETAYCDKLIELFEAGQLPLLDGVKLHDFLAHMLKSKQSRLTKKMKKAKLSSRSYARTSGYIVQVADARNFSELESGFYASLYCTLERSEIRFHIQREWREQFSSYCVAIGQPVDAEEWLSSVEEMDRRESQAKDAARKYRRKLMMGYALSHDSLHQERGVHIDPTAEVTEEETPRSPSSVSRTVSNGGGSNRAASPENVSGASPNGSSLNLFKQQQLQQQQQQQRSNASINRAAPFLSRVVQYLQRHSLPFEHVDAWVPSFVHNGSNNNDDPNNPTPVVDNNCRLCYAGCGTTETKTEIVNGIKSTVPLSSEDRFNLISFGEYSQKFSFDVGCGMPGRVYQNGMASWEQMIQNAPRQHFERCGGAVQWGIQTVVGIPVPSPNVGRIVVLFYSRQDRVRDADVVTRLSTELAKLLPAPKWKLVVDIGVSPFDSDTNAGRNGNSPNQPADHRIFKLLGLIVNYMPADKTSPHATYLPGFTSLKLILQEAVAAAASGGSSANAANTTNTPDELLQIILSSATSYAASGRSESDVAWMTARDYMLLSQQQRQQQHQQQQQLSHQVLMADLIGASPHSFPAMTNGANNTANVIHSTNSNDSLPLSFDPQAAASVLAQQSQTTAIPTFDPNLPLGSANNGLGFNWTLN